MNKKSIPVLLLAAFFLLIASCGGEGKTADTPSPETNVVAKVEVEPSPTKETPEPEPTPTPAPSVPPAATAMPTPIPKELAHLARYPAWKKNCTGSGPVKFISSPMRIENIILIIDSGNIVPDTESAYELIDFKRLKSGYFISGPSKTADIEQSLVIGAHGSKSLIVFVIRP